MRVQLLRRLAQVSVGQRAVQRLFPAPSRPLASILGRRGIIAASAEVQQLAEDKMASANGSSVSAEEVEALRKQLETLQVRVPGPIN